jgi:hypothetical protein
MWTLVVFDMFQDEHNQVVVFQLAQILDHLPLYQGFQLAINHGLKEAVISVTDAT